MTTGLQRRIQQKINAVAHANTILILSENNNSNKIPYIDHEYISSTSKGDWSMVNCWIKGDGAEFLYQHRSYLPLPLIFFAFHNFAIFSQQGMSEDLQGCVIPPLPP